MIADRIDSQLAEGKFATSFLSLGEGKLTLSAATSFQYEGLKVRQNLSGSGPQSHRQFELMVLLIHRPTSPLWATSRALDSIPLLLLQLLKAPLLEDDHT